MASAEAIIELFGHVHYIVSKVTDIFIPCKVSCLFIHLKAASQASDYKNKCLLV